MKGKKITKNLAVDKILYQACGERKLVRLYDIAFTPQWFMEGRGGYCLTTAETKKLIEYLERALEKGVEDRGIF